MNWYKTAKLYGDIMPTTDGEDQPRPVYVTLKDGTKKQVENVMIVPETVNEFKGKGEHKGWIGWGVAIKGKKGWETKKWFLNDWEAEEWVQKKYPRG